MGMPLPGAISAAISCPDSKVLGLVRIPTYPPTCSDNIRPVVPGYPPTFDALP